MMQEDLKSGKVYFLLNLRLDCFPGHLFPKDSMWQAMTNLRFGSSLGL